ncbi:hypothetical protein [Candidatus Mycoplasma haematohominis]|uniref:hypothetical protein n=1 Tax=Candidatus Mycoplasma haematohominis TaxID=1494318 RepID=UPI001C0A697A|nr:hypothetical protein [Candidatus Mycoplasma haemohominis]
MSTLKGAAALGAGAVIVGGTGFGVYRHLSHDPMPENYVVLAKSSDKVSDTAHIGNVYGDYLIAPFGDNGNDNKEWWDWSYRRWQADSENKNITLSGNFDKNVVKSSYRGKNETSGEEKSLNKICQTVYEKAKTEINKEANKPEKERLKNDLWKYCSVFGEAPKTVSDIGTENYGTGTFGEDKKDKLIGITGNDGFWKVKNKEFFERGDNNQGTGNGLTQATDSLFYDLYDSKNKGSRGDLRNTCGAAYRVNKTSQPTEPKVTETNLLKFCTLDK